MVDKHVSQDRGPGSPRSWPRRPHLPQFFQVHHVFILGYIFDNWKLPFHNVRNIRASDLFAQSFENFLRKALDPIIH